MKLLFSAAGIISLALVVPALSQTPPSAKPPATQGQPPSPGKPPATQGQPPPAEGQPATPPRRVPPRPVATRVVVRDQSGTPIAGTRVTVSGASKREATTDPKGLATLPSMPAGSYRLRFEHDGFITLERDVTVRAGQPAEIEVALNVAPEPPPPPKPETPPPPPPPPPSHIESTGTPVNVSIPTFLDKNFIGRNPLKESVLGCTSGAMTRLLQLRDPIAVHTHADFDEVLYVVAGEGTVHIRDDSTPVSAGSLTVIPRGVPHAFERRGKNPLIVLSTLAGSPAAPCDAAVTSQSGKK